MASQKTQFSVGLFALTGACIAILAIVWIGMSGLFQTGDLYVTYFDESVQGLEVGSAVKYRGVSVGRVERISVAPDSRLIEVLLKVETGQEVEKDTVAQLKSVGITGLVFVEMDRIKPDEFLPPLDLGFPTEYRVIPSKPSDFAQIIRGIDDFVRQIRDLDLAGISDRLKTALDKAALVMDEAEVKNISMGIQKAIEDVNSILDPGKWVAVVDSMETAIGSANEVLRDAGQAVVTAGDTLRRVDNIVSEKQEVIETALEDFGRAMESVNRLMEQGAGLVETTDSSVADIRGYLINAARNLERASENFDRLTENLMDQPSELLFRRPPPRRVLEPEP